MRVHMCVAIVAFYPERAARETPPPPEGIFCVLIFSYFRKDTSGGLLSLHMLFYFWVVMLWFIVDDASFVCLYSMLLRYIAHLRNLLCESLMGRVLSMGF